MPAMTTMTTMTTMSTTDGRGLFYLMGASGSGKDSLLRGLRERLHADDPVVVAHRYITRPADANEASVWLSAEEFERRRRLGCLALHWHSHGLRYGIGVEIDQWLARGLRVVVNGSREYLPEAIRRYPGLCGVHVRVAPEALARRLRQRARESEEAIAARLARATAPFAVPAGCRLVEIDNSGELAHAVEAFVGLVREQESAGTGRLRPPC